MNFVSESKMSNEELYNVCAWISRGDPDSIIRDYHTVCDEASEKARKTVQCELNIPYGNKNSNQKMDVYGTDLPADSLILAMIHGGGWRVGDRKEMGFIAEQMYNQGIVTVNIGYDLCPKVSMSEITKQIEAAAESVFSLAKRRRSRGVYFCGHSAGAHLASSLLCSSWYRTLAQDRHLFLGVILLSGLFDVTPLASLSEYQDLGLTEAEAKSVSPTLVLPPILKEVPSTRVLFAVEENGSPAFKTQSDELYKLLKGAGWPVKYIEVKGVDHFNMITLFAANEKNSTQKDMLDFIRS